MKLNTQKGIAARIFKVGRGRVWIDPNRMSEIKESITKNDIKALVKDNAIKIRPVRGISKARTRKNKIQKSKGRRKGAGSKKGKQTLGKRDWINKIRIQRNFVKELRDKEIVSKKVYQELYLKAKGGFFRSKRHIKLYLEEHRLGK